MKKTDAYSNNASPDEADDFVHNEDHDDDADDHSGLRKKRTSTLTFYGRFFLAMVSEIQLRFNYRLPITAS